MLYSLLADGVVVVHFAFAGFVVMGGLFAWRWPWLRWVHVPAVAWGVGIEWSGAVCPLTPWENWLRQEAGEVGYTGDFLGRYLAPLLYPAGLTRTGQVILGCLALAINVGAYTWPWYRSRRSRLLG